MRPGTLGGELYARVVGEFARGTRIVEVPGHGLAELVEAGGAGTPTARDAVQDALAREVTAGADTVVLGCTHYHFLEADIREDFPGVAIVDTSEAVARRALQVLREQGMEAPTDQTGALDLIVTGDRTAFRESMRKLGFEPSVKEGVS